MSTYTTPALVAAAALSALAAAGCEATFTPAEPVVTYYGGATLAPAPAVPVDIWAYPRVYYGGSYLYLVDGRWYQPTPSGWMTYRREPVELSRARTRIYASPGLNRRVVPRSPAYGYPRTNVPPPQPPVEYDRERTINPVRP